MRDGEFRGRGRGGDRGFRGRGNFGSHDDEGGNFGGRPYTADGPGPRGGFRGRGMGGNIEHNKSDDDFNNGGQ